MKKLAWIAPMDKKSAIAQQGVAICNILSDYFEIEFLTSKRLNTLNSSFTTYFIEDVINDFKKLDSYNYLIYNFGNNAVFHRLIYELFKKKPGIVILHDQTMFDFFYEYYPNKDDIVEFAASFYNDDEVSEVNKVLHGEQKLTYEADKLNVYNMILPLLKTSLGIFTHANFFINKLREYYARPISYSYLTCEKELENNSSIFNYIPNDERLLIVSTGFLNPYKKIESLIEVLKNHKELQTKIKFVVIGDYNNEYGNNIYNYVEKEMKDTVYMLGYQSSEVIDSALYNADLCVNLRYPNSEVCSLSVLEQMAYGKPVCVINSGIYSEIPDSCVVKIGLEHETKSLEDVVVNMVNNRDYYNLTGKNAKKFVDENCKIDIYVKKFIKLLEECDNYDYVEEDYLNYFINSIANKYHEMGITKANGEKYIDDAVNGMMNMLKPIV